jgi:hypothetical protein
MQFVIEIDNLIITADVHAYETSGGYHDIEYTIERVLELDEDDVPYDLSTVQAGEVLKSLGELIEKRLIEQIEFNKEESLLDANL